MWSLHEPFKVLEQNDFVKFYKNRIMSNKKVFLCERKRYSARRIASIASAVLSQEVPILTWLGVPHPDLGGVPSARTGLPPARIGVPPRKNLGPVTWERTWDLDTPGKDLRQVTWERTWDWGTPLPGCAWTNKVKTLPSLVLRTRAIINSQNNE